jgi:type I site-specific restriction-modification system R (restriction) subunit
LRATVEQIKENQGRLGVFWHIQGSGKSLSMVIFSDKVRLALRRVDQERVGRRSLSRQSKNVIESTESKTGIVAEHHARFGNRIRPFRLVAHDVQTFAKAVIIIPEK